MKDKDYYIQKAKRERFLTDEQIAFFLERCSDYTLLPYFCSHFKKGHDMQEALNWVLKMHPDTAVM